MATKFICDNGSDALVCIGCGSGFTFIRKGRGRIPSYCSPPCRTAQRAERLAANQRICGLDGCAKIARPGGAVCEMHYARMHRNGAFDLPQRPEPPNLVRHSQGYLLAYAPGHALAPAKASRVYQHRKVFYEAQGDGPFSCHVCGAGLTWQTMHVDHLDDDRTNNKISNLAPACPTCNQWRGHMKMVAKARAKGRSISFRGRCQTLAQWAHELGYPPRGARMIARRIDAGWSVERALTEPRGKTGPKRGVDRLQ